ncbi:MAG TPA: hypothetical protein VF636_08800 [Sphingomonas sp.]
MTRGKLLAIFAFVALLTIDYFLLVAAFLYTPAPAGWLIVLGLIAFAAAIAFRLRWLIFATHNLVTAILIVRVVQSFRSPYRNYDDAGAGSLAFIIFLIIFSNFLAWLVARGLSPRAGGDHRTVDTASR